MTVQGFALFDTAIGRCAIAWSGRGILAMQLPEADERTTRARVTRRFPQAREAPPPAAVRRAIESIAALLRGDPRDLSAVALDMEGVPPFHRRVYAAARKIPPGTTLRYGQIPARRGAPRSPPATRPAARPREGSDRDANEASFRLLDLRAADRIHAWLPPPYFDTDRFRSSITDVTSGQPTRRWW